MTLLEFAILKTLKEIKCRENVGYKKDSKTFSRIGKLGQIWFYVSEDFNASIAEMLPSWYSKKNSGEIIKIIVSRWHIRHDIKILIIPDLYNINEICKDIDLTVYNENKNFWSYICRKYRTTTMEDENIYEFTSAFANSLIDRSINENKNFEGVFYPSVQYPLKSNLALLPTTVDSEKIVLRDLYQIDYKKSSLLSIYGTPYYYPIDAFRQGFYEPK